MKNTIMMRCPRDYTLRTLSGHTVQFDAGESTPVPAAAYQEALSKNIVPVEIPDDDEPFAGTLPAEITGTLRDAMIHLALSDIAGRNHVEEFTGGGVPKAITVTQEVGIRLSQSEVGKYWSSNRQMLAENAPFPTHPHVEVVRELQSCATRKQLTEFAQEHGFNLPKADGKSVKELKEALLTAVINQQQLPPKDDAKASTLMMD